MYKYHFAKAKTILSSSNNMNIYRGCSHGCIYCDSRSKCYQMNHDFEDIEVKENALELLENALKRKRKKVMITTGAMTDPYIPIEEKLCYTRKSLQIIEKYNFGIGIQTKSNRILRDIDILEKINFKSKCVVQTTLTTYDEELCKIIEPNVSTTKERFEMLEEVKKHNIPTVVWLSPILPFINDSEENLKGILNYCIKANVYGIIFFGPSLTLREGNREYFYKRLDIHFPNLKEKYIKEYGNSYILISKNSKRLEDIFYSTCKKHNIVSNNNEIFKYINTYESNQQLSLFS